MGYIETKPVEKVIRKLFRQKDTVTFWEMVEGGFPLEEDLSYADVLARENDDREANLYQYELALDNALRNYLYMGCAYPVEWRDILDGFVERSREERAWELSERGLPEEGVVEFHSNARVRDVIELVYLGDGWSETPREYRQEFASAICRALNGWTKPTPPWLDQPATIRRKTAFVACQMVVVEWALPQLEDANEARKVEWKAGKSLFDASYIGGLDL